MQQRRLRLGDILDDYCPRERRITNHAVVAMIDDEVKQTRCTTCDADHEYKAARGPTLRRRKPAAPVAGDLVTDSPRPLQPSQASPSADLPIDGASDLDDTPDLEAPSHLETASDLEADHDGEPHADARSDDEGPVHRPLIRATLPRPEGQVPERKAPEFTAHQPARGRDGQGQGKRGAPHRGRRPQARQPQGAAGGSAGRFGNSQGQPRQPHGGARQGAQTSGRGGGRPAGQGRGPRPATGRGPKRGR
jgi:hypothetical protein